MEIGDYSRRLNQYKEKVNSNQKELRDTYNRNLEDLEENHELKQAKTSKNFEIAKANLEETNQKNQEFYSEKTKDTIKERSEAFQKDIGDNRENFDRDRKELKAEFDQRLNELRDSYEQSSKEQSKYNENRLDTANKNYERRYDRAKAEFDTGMENYKDSARSRFKDFKNDKDLEKRQIVGTYGNVLRDQIMESAVKKTIDKNEQQKEIQNLRDSQIQEIDLIKENNRLSGDELRRTKNNDQNNLQKTFFKLTEDISDRNQKQRHSEARSNAEKIDQIEKNYSQKIYQQRREAAEKMKSGVGEESVDNRMDLIRDNYEGRIRNIYGKVEDDKFRDQVDKERMADSFRDSIRSQSIKHSKVIDRNDKENRVSREENLKIAKTKGRKAVEDLKRELSKSDLRSEENSMRNRGQFKKLLSSQRKDFGDSIEKITEKNREGVENLQEIHRQEKSEYIEGMKSWHHAEMQELKDELRFNFGRKEMALNERNDQLKKINEKIIDEYENKLERLERKSFKEIEKIKMLSEQQISDQRRAMKLTLENKDRVFAKEKIETKFDYEKRLSEAKTFSDTQVAKLVERYEAQLNRQRDELTAKMRIKLNEAQENYSKLYAQSELEKVTTKQQLDNRIEELRKANEVALAEKAKEMRGQFFEA